MTEPASAQEHRSSDRIVPLPVSTGRWALICVTTVVLAPVPYLVQRWRPDQPMLSQTLAVAVQVAVLLGPLWLFGVRGGHLPWREVLRSTPWRRRWLPMSVLFGIGNAALAAVLITVVLTVRGGTSDGGGDPAPEFSLAGWALSAVLAGLVGPFVEEVFHRGVLLRGLVTRVGAPLAVVTGAVIFGASHASLLQGFTATVGGLLFGLWYLRTRSLFAAVAMHVANNLTGAALGLVVGLSS